MTLDWDGYEIYHPGVFGPLNTLPRAEAQGAYNLLMDSKRERIDMLGRLLAANGVELRTDDAGIQDLNDWFRATVQEDPDMPGRLLPDWYSVVNDVGLFLGDVMIERHPNLRWEFFTWGKRDVSYQRHVIMGFSTEDPKFRTNVDIDSWVATYGYRIIQGQEVEPDAFLSWLETIDRRA
jgi:hypothetical protein